MQGNLRRIIPLREQETTKQQQQHQKQNIFKMIITHLKDSKPLSLDTNC